MPPEPRLTVVGSINLDLVARVERLPRPGETVTDASFARYPGGKGANQAVAAARLGAAVTMYGAVGTDGFADEALSGLVDAGVELELERGGDTGVALILVARDGETQIVVVPGANARCAYDDAASATLCQLEIPVETVVRAAEGADRFFLNAAPAREIPRALVERAEVVVVNRYELDALPATPGLTALTLGSEGAVLLEDGEEVARAAPPHVDAVDGTAAGDAFTACLVVSLLEGRDHEESLRRACAAGALAASRSGAQPSLPTAAEVDAILA
ncbi:MAG: ribokinase [Actinomycetota bacterium]|nr:ribokinase [Actinomycetota bacterium]